jgi:hypothetical protein
MAGMKVVDPAPAPVSVLAELRDLRAALDLLRLDNERLRLENERLQRELTEARQQLDQARRSAKRQAAPFSKGQPKAQAKRPGRKAGDAHGRHGHRPPPAPGDVDETHEANLPGTCPGCGGAVEETGVASQYQAEIPRKPITRRFNVHLGRCLGCGTRLRGRHPLQTSDALGAAASQLGPDAQAALVVLNKDAGLSHGKAAAVMTALFGVPVTRGASAQVALRAAGRLGPAHGEIIEDCTPGSAGVPPVTPSTRTGARTRWSGSSASAGPACWRTTGGRPTGGSSRRPISSAWATSCAARVRCWRGRRAARCVTRAS